LQDVRQQVFIALRWLPLILIGALGAAALAYVVVNEQPKVYEATARLVVNPGQEPSVQDLELAASAATRYADQALSRPVVEAVLAELGLEEGVQHLAGRLDADPVEDTFEVTLAARDADPAAAQLLATTLAEDMRQRVRDVLVTVEVKKADDAIASARQRIRGLENRLDRLRRKGNLTQLEQIEYNNLPGQISDQQLVIRDLLPGSSAFVRNRLDWLERPTLPEDSVEPRPLYTALLALVVGGMLAVAFAFILEYLRRYNKIRDERDLEAGTGLPVLGSVAEKRGDARRGGMERLVMLRYPRSREAEAYRALLARIGFAGGLERTLMVASAGASDGKSAVAANLALAYAEAGRNVVLVDADLRSPRLHTLLGVPNDRGVTNVLVDRDAPLQWVIVPTPHPRLRLMPAGPPPPRLSGPLGAQQVDALLDALLQVADVVVFDAPPVAGSLDAAVLATQLKEAVLVVPAGARTEDVAEATRVLQGASAELMGTILYQQVRGSHRRADAAPVPQTSQARAPWPATPPPQSRPLPAVMVPTEAAAAPGRRPPASPDQTPALGRAPSPTTAPAAAHVPTQAASPRPAAPMPDASNGPPRGANGASGPPFPSNPPFQPPSQPYGQASQPLQQRGAPSDG
jgi:succinoglycan biosynthesis transport protein ExoP